jgi:uncharacterized membrane protein YphA (DoxX/SURF4 family)
VRWPVDSLCHLRWAALALAGFTLFAPLISHTDFSNQMQTIHFMKKLAMVGGLLIFVEHGAGHPSLEGSMAGAKPSPRVV